MVAIPCLHCLTQAGEFEVPAETPPATSPLAELSGKNPLLERGDALSSTQKKNRFSVGYHYLGNVDVDFSRLGGFVNPLNSTLALPGGPQNREYDNGFVRVDSSGNQGEMSWYWGYDSDDQINPANSTLSMSVDNSPANLAVGDTGNGHGLEFAYERLLGTFSLDGAGREVHYGLRVSLSYSRLEAGRNARLSGDIVRTTDAFDLGDIIPPLAPYEGSFEGPGPLLGSSPVSRTNALIAGGALVDVDLEANVDIFSLGIGPFFEYPVTRRLQLTAEAGLSLNLLNSDLTVEQTVTLPGIGTQSSRADGSESAIRLGAFADLGLSYAIREDVFIFAVGRWNYIDSFDHAENGFQVDYGFDKAMSGIVGVRVRW